jgi:hypothetical protein
MSLKDNLRELVSKELLEAAWYGNLPLQRVVAIDCFLNGFRANGIHTIARKNAADFTLLEDLGQGKAKQAFRVTVNYDEVLKAKGNGVSNSITILWDAACNIYDLGKTLAIPERDQTASVAWETIKTQRISQIRHEMDQHLLKQIRRYQENLFISITGQVPNLEKPTLFNEVFSRFPTQLYYGAMIADQLNESPYMDVGSPDAAEMPRLDYDDFDSSAWHPSEATLDQLFTGQYLYGFAKRKGYSANDRETILKTFINEQHRAFDCIDCRNWDHSTKEQSSEVAL